MKSVYSTKNTYQSEVTQYKYNEVWITRNLTWTKQIYYVTSNALPSGPFIDVLFSTHFLSLLSYNIIALPTLDWLPFGIHLLRLRLIDFISYAEKGRPLYL